MKASYGRYAILGALLAAFMAAMGHLSYLRGLERRQTVVVVSREIPAFQQVDEPSLKLVEVPVSAMTEGALTSLEAARGKYTRGLLVPGTVLRQDHLLEAVGGTLASRLTQGGDARSRAMALKVTPDKGVANTLVPGDKVDVLVAFKVDGALGQGRTTVAKIIAQGIPVLHTTFEKAEGLAATGSREGTVVLQVAPEVAEEIALAETGGAIWLLTTPYSADRITTEGVTVETFISKYQVKVPVAATGAGDKSRGGS